jgi:phosphohistidine phosphatase
MDLILLRHAQAEDGEPDAARRLTRRGQRDAVLIANWIVRRLPERDVSILSSPTRRTRQTAEAFGRRCQISDRLGPQASVEDVIDLVDWPDRRDGVLIIVGHQPWIGEVIATLVAGQPEPWPVRKGAFWWLSPPADGSRQAPARVRAVLGPDLLR